MDRGPVCGRKEREQRRRRVDGGPQYAGQREETLVDGRGRRKEKFIFGLGDEDAERRREGFEMCVLRVQAASELGE